jgi:hypothetical protein
MFRIKPAFILLLILSVSVSATIINVPYDAATIQDGILATFDGDTVLVQPNIYHESINFSEHNVVVASLFLTTGDTGYISQTVIDSDSLWPVVIINRGEDNSAMLIGFTIQHGSAAEGAGIYCIYSSPTIAHNIIKNNYAIGLYGGVGGGIYCQYSSLILKNNLINNVATGAFGGLGGGIYCEHGAPLIEGNVIKNNLGDFAGGGIFTINSTAVINRNIIVGNQGTYRGGGIFAEEDSSLVMNCVFSHNRTPFASGGGIYGDGATIVAVVNSIFHSDSSGSEHPEIMVDDTAQVIVSYSCFNQDIHYGEGNFLADPLFRDPAADDYHLMAIDCGDQYDSPCIDTGDPDIMDDLLDCAWGLGTMVSDIGAYGGGDTTLVGIASPVKSLPQTISLLQNYPNPFNACTTIDFELPKPGIVTLDIYDLTGRKVTRLVNQQLNAGNHSITWDAGDMASGVYFYRLQTDGYRQSRKMILLK